MTTTTTKQPETLARNPRACFSFAAYAKAVVGGLVGGGGAAVDAGLTAAELAAIESSLGFSFPPDLRALLAEALPVSPGFPNWRSPSPSLLLLLRRPYADLLRAATLGPLWPRPWGPRPDRPSDRADRARETLDRAPILVPIYRRFYVPASPALAGNPVFHVRAGEVRVAAVDIADFFARWGSGVVVAAAAAAWGGKREAARRVEVWTEMAEEAGTCGRGEAARAVERGLAEMGARLREAGWGEEEVQEMMMMRAGSDGDYGDGDFDRTAPGALLRDRESVAWHVRLLALALRRAGWSAGDVAETMGCFSAVGPTRAVTWRVDPAGDHISLYL